MEKEEMSNLTGQEKVMEVLMPIELIEQLFDGSRRIGYETTEERELRERREDYNQEIVKKIMQLNFTEKQRMVMDFLFFKGWTMAQTAREMGVAIGTIQKIKKALLKKASKRIQYEFKINEE